MKLFALAAALGVVAIAAPANAAKWSIDYTGWWEEGFLSGEISADDDAALDGIVGLDEITSWNWQWSGNSEVPEFYVSSNSPDAEIQIFSADSGFYVDGTPNLPDLLDGLDQGVFTGGNYVLDLEFVTVTDNSVPGFPFDGASTFGDPSAAQGTVSVESVPEPTVLLGLLTLVTAASLKRQRQEA